VRGVERRSYSGSAADYGYFLATGGGLRKWRDDSRSVTF
jgi:hypothetical protein